MKTDTLGALNKARSERRPIAVVTRLSDGAHNVLTPDNWDGHPLAGELNARVKSGKSGTVDREGEDHFVAMHLPSPRLVLIGAVHISQALYPMAQACGFDVTIIDPRTAFATPERFANVSLHAEWPQDILIDEPLDAFTALAALTHDPKIDDIPLQSALAAKCFYVGALGSRKTHAKRCDRLGEAGVAADALSRIEAPIGLDIGAANPAEIAVAVMGSIIKALRHGDHA